MYRERVGHDASAESSEAAPACSALHLAELRVAELEEVLGLPAPKRPCCALRTPTQTQLAPTRRRIGREDERGERVGHDASAESSERFIWRNCESPNWKKYLACQPQTLPSSNSTRASMPPSGVPWRTTFRSPMSSSHGISWYESSSKPVFWEPLCSRIDRKLTVGSGTVESNRSARLTSRSYTSALRVATPVQRFDATSVERSRASGYRSPCDPKP